jgi:histidyl-tRNA synthetase
MVQRLVAKLDREAQQEGVRRFIQAAQVLAQIHGPAHLALEQLAAFLGAEGLEPTTHQQFEQVVNYLEASGLTGTSVNFGYGRTLHYYSGLIFELRHQGVTICGGGRYDGLLKSLGGPDCPTVGFSYNVEAICQALAPKLGQEWQLPGFVQVRLSPATPQDYGNCMRLAQELRATGQRVLVTEAGGIVIAGDTATLADETIAATELLERLGGNTDDR